MPLLLMGAMLPRHAVAQATSASETATPPFVLGGYAEAFYQWNFANPDNGITNARGFDNRHNTFTLANVALDTQWDVSRVVGRVTLQVGHTPSTYYLAEPSAPGSGAANGSDAALWKYVQQAYAGYRFDVGRGLLVTAGLFLSPIGPESVAVKDNWNWSRSDLFFGLPFYHTGLRASYPLDDAWTVNAAVYNGWNSVVDNNAAKSLSAQVTYTDPEVFSASVLYFTGAERASGAAEGDAWRHLLDFYGTWYAQPWLTLMAHADGGVEPNDVGTSAWLAGALYGRARLHPALFAALRADAFYEHVPANGGVSASPIFWPVTWVTSATATLSFEPEKHVSFRLEYRHDHAAGDLYFGGRVPGDGDAVPFAPNRHSQDTVTLGVTAHF